MKDINSVQQLSDALASAVEEASVSVVRVEARHRGASSGIVWSADGVIVTADHKVERDEDIRIGLPDGREVPAAIAGRDPRTDIAVLRADASGLRPASWSGGADFGGLKVGNLVLALSRPGRTARATLGIVSALGDEWQTPAGGKVDRYLETDAAHPPGFTGGLLVDAAGRALGMNDAGFHRGRGVAIPPGTLTRVVEALLAHGGVKRGYLGIGAHPVRLPAATAQATGKAVGLIVVGVQPGSPAEQAGLVLGDVLLALDGQAIGDLGGLQSALDEGLAGKAVTLRILRGGEARDVAVTLGSK